MTQTRPTPETVTVHIPFRIVKRGGRKEMLLPPGRIPKHRPDNTLIKALARAFRWKRMLDLGDFATTAELAEHEKIAPTYMARVLRLTLLAPEIVEGILNGHRPDLTLAALFEPFPAAWHAQTFSVPPT